MAGELKEKKGEDASQRRANVFSSTKNRANRPYRGLSGIGYFVLLYLFLSGLCLYSAMVLGSGLLAFCTFVIMVLVPTRRS